MNGVGSLAIPPPLYGALPRKVGAGKKLIAAMTLVVAASMVLSLVVLAVSDSLSVKAVQLLSARQFYKLTQSEDSDSKQAGHRSNVKIAHGSERHYRSMSANRYGTAFPPNPAARRISLSKYSAPVKQAARLCGIHACSASGCKNDAFFACMAMRSNSERYKLILKQYPGLDLTMSHKKRPFGRQLARTMLSKHHHHHHHHKGKGGSSGLSANNLVMGELGSLPDESNLKEGELANLPVDKNLIQGELAGLPAELNLIEGELGNLPMEKNLINGELGDLPAEPHLMDGELADLPPEKNLIVGELGDLPPEADLINGELGNLPAEPNLIVGELGGLPAEPNLIEGELGNLPPEKNLIQGELGDLPAEKNLIQGELGTFPTSTVAKDCGAGACDPATGCNDQSFFTCMMHEIPAEKRIRRDPGLGFNY